MLVDEFTVEVSRDSKWYEDVGYVYGGWITTYKFYLLSQQEEFELSESEVEVRRGGSPKKDHLPGVKQKLVEATPGQVENLEEISEKIRDCIEEDFGKE